MSDNEVLARWKAERRPAAKSHCEWIVVFMVLLFVGTILAAHITFSLLWRRPPEAPIERLLSPARREQIGRCFEIGDALGLVIYKAQMNNLRYVGHPYLFEGERARLALEMEKCR